MIVDLRNNKMFWYSWGYPVAY